MIGISTHVFMHVVKYTLHNVRSVFPARKTTMTRTLWRISLSSELTNPLAKHIYKSNGAPFSRYNLSLISLTRTTTKTTTRWRSYSWWPYVVWWSWCQARVGEDQSSRSKEMVRTEDLPLLKMGKEAEVNGNVAVVGKTGRLVGSSNNPSLCNVDIPCSQISRILWIKSNHINGNDE